MFYIFTSENRTFSKYAFYFSNNNSLFHYFVYNKMESLQQDISKTI